MAGAGKAATRASQTYDKCRKLLEECRGERVVLVLQLRVEECRGEKVGGGGGLLVLGQALVMPWRA